MAKEKLYYIKNGYVGNAVLWWGISGKGYVTDIRLAGKFSKEEAKMITQRPEDIAWECDYIDGLEAARKVIIDSQYMTDKKKRIVGRRR